MDTVFISGLKALSRIGHTLQERQHTQRLQFDLKVAVDLERAALSGSLDDTICYKELSELVTKLSLSKEWALLEQLGAAVIEQVFERWKSAQAINLELKKFVIAEAEATGIVMERKRK